MAPVYCEEKLIQQAAPKRQSDINSKHSSKTMEIPSISASAMMCRICLKDDGAIPIFPADGSLEIQEAIRDFTGLPLSADDAYPKQLCEQCHNLLQSAILFRETAKKSYKIMTSMEFLIKEEKFDTEAIEFPATTATTEDDNVNRSFKKIKKLKKEVTLESNTLETEAQELAAATAADEDDSLNKAIRNKSSKLKNDMILKEYFDEVETKENGEILKINPDEKDPLTVPKVQCRLCSKVMKKTSYRNHYNLHMDNSEQANTSHVCDVCGKCFRSKKICEVHRTTHTNNFPFKCQFCPYRGRYSNLLITHMRTHNKEYKHKCTVCSAKFINSSNLIRHSYTHKEPTIQCRDCSKKFHTQPQLKKHFEVSHLGMREHVCSLCGATFAFPRGLRKHEIKIHKREKQCNGRLPSYLLETKGNS